MSFDNGRAIVYFENEKIIRLYCCKIRLVIMDLVSKILIHKLGPNHVGIGSRTERSRVPRKAKN